MGRRFEGKVVIVTGSSAGIGRSALIAYAKEGASVVLHGINPERIQQTEKALKDAGIPAEKYLIIAGPIEKEEIQQKLIDETISKFGRLDVLVNNAGLTVGKNMNPLTIENFDFVMSVNLRAPFRLIELALPHLKKSKGNIINVSSVCGMCNPIAFEEFIVYGMTKSALDRMTKNYCVKLAEFGVRINNINPGPVETNIHDRNAPDNSPAYGDKVQKLLNRCCPLRRGAAPEELDDVFLLLAEEKSSYITGACWEIDGGMVNFAPSPNDYQV
uniref:Uncharacterized protein n=1 Tax=Panagrolaimus davidi TaxID=227884 RepID=A0A914PLY2_9BILA